MIVRKFKPEDLKRVFEIENMSFDHLLPLIKITGGPMLDHNF